MIDRRALDAVESSDTDELVRIVDGWCAARDWDDLLTLRLHLAAAVERGKQLWGVDEHIRYRLALEGPAEMAGAMIVEGPARFTLGPLPEVAASRLAWSELSPHVGSGPAAAFTAHERVIRGEDLTSEPVDPHVLETPLALQSWEPAYPAATFHSDRAEFPSPPPTPLRAVDLPTVFAPVSDPEVTDALGALTSTWVDHSSGRAETRAVEGHALAAVAALGLSRALAAEIDAATGFAWMGWAAASGGAHGRRKGAAAGRFGAWWAATALAGLEWPPDPDELGEAVGELRWFLWSDGDTTGWRLQLAVEDPDHHLAWAITAVDLPPDPTP